MAACPRHRRPEAIDVGKHHGVRSVTGRRASSGFALRSAPYQVYFSGEHHPRPRSCSAAHRRPGRASWPSSDRLSAWPPTRRAVNLTARAVAARDVHLLGRQFPMAGVALFAATRPRRIRLRRPVRRAAGARVIGRKAGSACRRLRALHLTTREALLRLRCRRKRVSRRAARRFVVDAAVEVHGASTATCS